MEQISTSFISSHISGYLARQLGFKPEDIDDNENLGSYGLNSMQAVELVGQLEDRLGIRLKPVLAFQYPTVSELAVAVYDLYSGATSARSDG